MAEPDSLILPDAEATRRHGRRLAAAVQAAHPAGLIVYLEGDLGAGKTTLARGFLEGLGHEGRVPSPTYTLIEPYFLSDFHVYHIDLYRIRAARELDDLDLAGQLGATAIGLVEWPDHGADHLPGADLVMRLEIVAEGRMLSTRAPTEPGRAVLAMLSQRPHS